MSNFNPLPMSLEAMMGNAITITISTSSRSLSPCALAADYPQRQQAAIVLVTCSTSIYLLAWLFVFLIASFAVSRMMKELTLFAKTDIEPQRRPYEDCCAFSTGITHGSLMPKPQLLTFFFDHDYSAKSAPPPCGFFTRVQGPNQIL